MSACSWLLLGCVLTPASAAAIGQVGDLVTTQIALQRGAVEGNPVVPSQPLANAAVQGGVIVGTQLALHALAPHHPRLTRWIGWTVGIVEGGVTVRNVVFIRGQR